MQLVGKPLRLIHVVDFEEQKLDLSEYKGKVVLVDFWASWCMQCMRELPNIREVYGQFQKDGLEIIAINMDDDPEKARKFIADQELPWKNYRFSDAAGFDSSFAQKNGIRAIPFLLLVGKDGTVEQLHVRGDRLAPAVRTALGMENNLNPTE